MNMKKEWIGFQTLIWKEIYRFGHIWTQTILPSAITTALYFLIFGNLIGARIGEFKGVPYIEFIVPGLLMMAVITNSYANVVSSFFMMKFFRSIEELLSSPLKTRTILFGFVGGGVARGLAVGFVVTLVSLFFTKIKIFNWLITLSILFLSTLFFSLGGLTNGIFAKKFDDINIIPTFFLTPLTFLGGVFYSIEVLPPFWQKISLFNPILYLVSAFRYGINGVSDVNIIFSYVMIIFFIGILGTLNYYLIKKGIKIKE